MSRKYLLQKHIDCQESPCQRFYFDTLDELLEYINKNKENILNHGFKRNEVRIIEIKKEV